MYLFWTRMPGSAQKCLFCDFWTRFATFGHILDISRIWPVRLEDLTFYSNLGFDGIDGFWGVKHSIMARSINLPSSALLKWVCRVYVYRHWLDWFEKSSIEKFEFQIFQMFDPMIKCAAQRFGSPLFAKIGQKNLNSWKILEAPLLLNHAWFNHAPVRMSCSCHLW